MDRDILLAARHAQGGDFWATADGRWGVGSPFSTLDCGLMLAELGVAPDDPLVQGIAATLFACQTPDGRFRPGPKLGVQPCHTASALRLLCRLGLSDDPRLEASFAHLLATQEGDGGWRCRVLKFGAGPDTDASNPGVTLAVLDALRFRPELAAGPEAARAVASLLDHWRVRRPLGPCRYGIGTQFMRVEYPMFRYNLFFWVEVLSFYPAAVADPGFRAALAVLEASLQEGRIVVGYARPALRVLELCRPGVPNTRATARFEEIRRRVGG